jgi:septum formation protein
MIILASKSPRRKQLLEQANIAFEIIVEDTEEYVDPNLAITQVPIVIAQQKAAAIKNKVPSNAIILAADTIVVVENRILGKPANEAEAIAMLQLLQGKKHLVITGVHLQQNDLMHSFSCTTEVFFNSLTVEESSYYVQQYKPYDKAGSYAIQEWIGVVAIEKINGCFYNVMGLPVSQIRKALITYFNWQP